jgi:adenylate cyclase
MAYSYGVYVLGLESETAFDRAKEHAGRALVLDGENPVVNAYAAFTYHVSGEPELAMEQAERAVALNPHDPFALYVHACALNYIGKPELALDSFARSERLQPYAADDQRLDSLCDCYFMLGQYDKVIDIHRKYQNMPAFLYLVRAAAHAHLGQVAEVKIAVETYERLRPPLQDYRSWCRSQLRMCARQEDRDRWREGYRKAGLEV